MKSKDDYLNKYQDYLKNIKKLSKDTIKFYLDDIKKFLDYINKDVKEISINDINIYIYDLIDEKYSNAYVLRKIAALKSYFSYLFNNNEIAYNPMFEFNLDIKRNSKKTDKLDSDIIKEIIEAPLKHEKNKNIAYRDYIIMNLLYYSKMDVNTILNLKKENLFLNVDLILTNGKNYTVNPKNKMILNKYLAELDQDKIESKYVLLNSYRNRMTRQSVWNIVKKYVKIVNVEDNISPRTLLLS